ncbi:MAG: hypothetical protein KGZ75_01750 [Syntrophomonadaceae bacterium]|nr:hypothetical protein [Syntrophomonadaceae bacterium]
MKNTTTLLQKERNYLLNQWINARETEKARILVRLMDIDDQLDVAKKMLMQKPRKKVI